ncbi:rCG35968 [Rattus norvegicus]|uniref:RCG35968 n=1 Tax=Rattus norvegicus TaxID=10116 RepID=A6IJE3_RAT|nr:rCG35968 [Rattus norvegicus]
MLRRKLLAEGTSQLRKHLSLEQGSIHAPFCRRRRLSWWRLPKMKTGFCWWLSCLSCVKR